MVETVIIIFYLSSALHVLLCYVEVAPVLAANGFDDAPFIHPLIPTAGFSEKKLENRAQIKLKSSFS